MTPAEVRATVVDEASFLAFVRELLSKHTQGIKWEHEAAADFLEAGLAWADDSHFGSDQGLAGATPWAKVAGFLSAATLYE